MAEIQRCSNCICWRRLTLPGLEEMGECHRNAPLPVVLPLVPAYDPDEGYVAPDLETREPLTVWPPVRGDDWCRQWEPNPLESTGEAKLNGAA